MPGKAGTDKFTSEWRWTLTSGLLTLLLAVAAVMIPVIDWAPKGGLVGWLLLLAGAAEFAFGLKRGNDTIGKAAIISGLLAAFAGLVFVANPFAAYFAVANVVMVWLLVRGVFVLIMALRTRRHRTGAWLAVSGAADLLLGLALALGTSVSAFVVILFGVTPEIVAAFGLVLGASFLVTGASQVAIARIMRRSSCTDESPSGAGFR